MKLEEYRRQRAALKFHIASGLKAQERLRQAKHHQEIRKLKKYVRRLERAKCRI